MPRKTREKQLPTGVLGERGMKSRLDRASCLSECYLHCRYCEHGLRPIRASRPPPDADTPEPRDFRDRRHYWDLASATRRRITRTVIFPGRHEVRPANLQPCGEMIGSLLAAGCQVVVCTRASFRCVAALCHVLQRKTDLLAFRVCLGSADDNLLGFWEPGTPSVQERVEALEYAQRVGFQTSVAIDPILDTTVAGIARTIETVSPYVTDTVWLGTLHNLFYALACNGWGDAETCGRAHELAALLSPWYGNEIRGLTRKYPRVRLSSALEAKLSLLEEDAMHGLNTAPARWLEAQPDRAGGGLQKPCEEKRLTARFLVEWGVGLGLCLIDHWTFSRQALDAGMTPAQIGWLSARMLELAGDLTPEARRAWLEAILQLLSTLQDSYAVTGLRFLVQRALDQHNQANAQSEDGTASTA